MLPDLLNFINENGLKIMLEIKGWSYAEAFVIKDLAIVKPDFYPDLHILAMGKKGYIYASGQTRIEYAGKVFSSTDELLSFCGIEAIEKFTEWVFLEEKEWVVTNGRDWLHSFSTLDKLPKRTTFRC